MLDKKIEQAFNDQLNFEIFSANIYMSMAAHFDSMNLKGFANWMKIQYQEEIFHMTKFYDFINERGGHVVIGAIESPPTISGCLSVRSAASSGTPARSSIVSMFVAHIS